MRYIIKNGKGAYLKLNSNGAVTRCSRNERQEFEEQKAKNILGSLPKLFEAEVYEAKTYSAPEQTDENKTDISWKPDENTTDTPYRPDENKTGTVCKPDENKTGTHNEVIIAEEYEVPENVSRWSDKFSNCYDTIREAEKRLQDLYNELTTVDNQFLDIIHEIELNKSKDLYGGWRIYNKIKNNRRKRRDIKDEILILKDIVEKVPNLDMLSRDNIEKRINGLATRKYKVRAPWEDEEDEF